MKKLIFIIIMFTLTSCGSNKVIHERDITNEAKWLESTEDNPIINVIQKAYKNHDVEIVIKKKLTTDYVKLRLRNGKRIINKTTKNN